MSMNTREISANLSRITEQMLSCARELGDNMTALTLERQAAGLKKGLVRVALIGSTSSGKSTIINALLGKLVVPENPSVSSPVPVWIHHHESDAIHAEVVRRQDGAYFSEQMSTDAFMTRYCYNVDDITNARRVRFENIIDASVALKSDLLESGAILIDTLGIAATTVDTGKTLAVLNEGVDLIIFCSKNAQLHQDEVAFLREYVLGYAPEKHRVNYPADPKNLILVLNDFGGGARPRDAFLQSTKAIFAEEMSNDAHESWAKSNVFDLQALLARFARCGAVYPYDRLAPEGSTKQEKAELAERMEGEEELFEAYGSDPSLAKASGIHQLQKGLETHIARRTVGRESVVLTRIYSLTQILTRIRNTVGIHLADVATVGANLQTLRQDIKQFDESTKADKATLINALNVLKSKYITSFNTLFHEMFGSGGTTGNALLGRVLQLPMPAEFASFDPRAFHRMSPQQKVEALDPYVDEAVEAIFAFCRTKILQQLETVRSNANGISTPFEVLEESRVYVTAQAAALNNRIDALEALELADKLGVMLPGKKEVESFFISLQTELEQNLLQAISDTLSGGLDKFNAQRPNFVKSVSGNFFRMLLNMLGGPEAVWNQIRKHYFIPMVAYVLSALGDFCNANVAGGLADAVGAAYTNVLMEITDRRQSIVVALENALTRIDTQIKEKGTAAIETKKEMQDILALCDQLTAELNRYQTELLQSFAP